MISGPLGLVPITWAGAAPGEGEHSELGASSSFRWLNSAGCRNLLRTVTRREAGEAANRGNLWHGYAARRLVTGEWEKEVPADVRLFLAEYVDHVLEVAHKHNAECGAEVSCIVEQRIGAPGLHKDLWGTNDVAIYCHGCGALIVGDLKTGAGIFVEATPNSQLRLYAAYVCVTFGLTPNTIDVFISQPSIDCTPLPGELTYADGRIRYARVTQEELDTLLREAVTAAKASENPAAKRTPGPWCSKTFCDAMAVCPERAADNALILKQNFSPQVAYDPAALSAAFLKVDEVRATCEAIVSFAYQEANRGVKLPALKLVDKNLGPRQWNDKESAIIEKLKANEGVDHRNIYSQPDLMTPPQVEASLKAAGMAKSKRDAVLAPLIRRESSGTTLVRDTDPRPEKKVGGGFSVYRTLDDLL